MESGFLTEGSRAWTDATGVTTYVPKKEELEEIGFEVGNLFASTYECRSHNGNLTFKMTNTGTDWKVYLTVKDGMFINTTTCWIIHPTSMQDVEAVIKSFTQVFIHRRGGTS